MLEKFVAQKEEIIGKIDNILKFYEEILKLNLINKEVFFKQRSNNFFELRERIKKEKITIGVMATVSNGKSTFLNALVFEDNVLQAQSGETTAALFEIRYGDRYKIDNEIISKDEMKRKIKEINQQLLKKIQDNQNKKFSYEKIIIEFPFEKLKHVVLLDTPGYGSINEIVMMRILNEASKKSDIIVLILDVSQGLKKEDKIFLEKIKENNLVHKTFIVLNKLDAIMNEDDFILKSEEEIQEEIKNVIKTTKVEINKIVKTDHIYPLSAKKALVAKIKKLDETKLQESKFEEFENIFWKEAIKLKGEKFEKEIKAFDDYKQSLCDNLKEEIKYEQKDIQYIKELIDTILTHEIASELEVLKATKEKLANINFNFELENSEVKRQLLNKLESDLRWELKNVGFFDSFSESAWKEAINKGMKEFEKDFGEIFFNDYFIPLLKEVQKNVDKINRIIREINISIEKLNKLTGKKLEKFDTLKEDYKISTDGKFTYSSEEFVNLLEDLGFSVAAGAAGYGIGVAIEFLAGRVITFAIPAIGWILAILAAGYTFFEQSNKWQEILRMVLNEVKPQVLETFNQKQIEVQNRLISKKNDDIQMRIGGIISNINEIEKVLTQKENEKKQLEKKSKQIKQTVNTLNKIYSQIC